jgi:hypothetical protein
MHGIELLHEQRTTLYPSVKGLLSGFGTTAWLVEQSQFGLAIGTDLKHVNGILCFSITIQIYEISTTKPNKSRSFSPLSGHIGTLKDIVGHYGTLGFGHVLSLHRKPKN